MSGEPPHGPLFVVGAARSGTKLLRALLDAHPLIALPEVETSILPLLVREWPRFGDLSDPPAWDAFVRWCARFLYFRDMADLGRPVDTHAWRAACRGFDLASVYEALVRLGAGVGPDEPVIWGDKTPGHLVHLPLLRLYPRLRVVHIVRDGRDVSLSSKEAWGKHPLRTAQRWNDDVRKARADGPALGAAYHELRFEDLVADPEAVLGRICAFLGVAYDPVMLAASSGERGGTAKGRGKGVFGDAGSRWRRDLDPATRRSIEEVGGELLAELGYELPDGMPPQRRTPGWRLAALQAADGTRLLRFRLREWGAAGVLRYGWRTLRAAR